MKNLRKNINKFYREYDLSRPFDHIKLSKDDMYDMDTLMTAYEAMWETMEDYDKDSASYAFISKLYGDLSDYIDYLPERPHQSYVPLIKAVSCVITACAIFTTGMHIGRHNTIREAELVDITDSEYFIDFGGEVHVYGYDLDVASIKHTDNGTLYIFEDGTGYYTENLVSIEERTQNLVSIEDVE